MIMTHLLSDDACGLCDVSAVVCEAERGGTASSIQGIQFKENLASLFNFFFSVLVLSKDCAV